VPVQVRKLPDPQPNTIRAITAPADKTNSGDLEAEISPGTSVVATDVPLAEHMDAREHKGSASSAAAALRNATPPCATSSSASAPSGSALPSVAATEPKTAVQHSATPTTRIQPLSRSSYRVVFTAPEALKQKIDRARELLSHSVSPSDLPALIERAIDLLIEHEARRRFATGSRRKTTATHQSCQSGQLNADSSQDPERIYYVDRCSPETESREDSNQQNGPRLHEGANPPDDFNSRRGSPPRRSRYVPAAVRRAVWERDEGQCTFIDADGNRCKERCFLEIDHRFPHAIGGAATVENCRLLCRCHNRLSSEMVFGRRKIDTEVAQTRGSAKARKRVASSGDLSFDTST